MFCPNCGQEKLGPETTFCSRCGFLLSGTAALLEAGGNLPAAPGTTSQTSKRKRGVKQGLFIFLLTFLVVPIVAMISIWLRVGPEITSLVAVLLSMGGLLRMAYAWLLEDGSPAAASSQQQLGGSSTRAALPPERSIPAADYAYQGPGNWRDTNELQPSVTENTTRLLDHEQPPQ